MQNIIFEKAHLEGNEIKCERSSSSIFNDVNERSIVIIKNLFPKEKLIKLRQKAFAWGTQAISEIAPGTNHHVILFGKSPRQNTPHAYHAFNFNWQCLEENNELHDLVKEIFYPMLKFQHQLTGNTSETINLLPQIIHYPQGGGMLADHIHAYAPQKIGLILNMSERTVDYQDGGVGFQVSEQQRIDIQNHHNIGDMALFRFDLIHGVSPVDKDKIYTNWNAEVGRWETENKSAFSEVNYLSSLGRWVAVLSVQY